MEAAFVCRSAADDCDLEEYCSGRDAFCPDDVFKWNGNKCTVDGVSQASHLLQLSTVDGYTNAIIRPNPRQCEINLQI